MTNFINLTPHAINFITGNETISHPPSGDVARVSSIVIGERTLPNGDLGSILGPGPVTGLPDPREGVVLIVSGQVRQALDGSGRKDVVSPGTDPAQCPVRHPEKGWVTGVTQWTFPRP